MRPNLVARYVVVVVDLGETGYRQRGTAGPSMVVVTLVEIRVRFEETGGCKGVFVSSRSDPGSRGFC